MKFIACFSFIREHILQHDNMVFFSRQLLSGKQRISLLTVVFSFSINALPGKIDSSLVGLQILRVDDLVFFILTSDS